MSTTRAFAFFAILLGTASVSRATPPTAAASVPEKGWQKHPAIVEVRARVAEVDALAGDHKLVEVTGRGECADDPGRVTLLRDAAGKVRRLTLAVGSEDSAATFTATYDATGILRFVLVDEGAISGGRLTLRNYFDARGAPLFHNEQLTGADYTWWRPDAAVFALLNAPERVAAQGPCALTTTFSR